MVVTRTPDGRAGGVNPRPLARAQNGCYTYHSFAGLGRPSPGRVFSESFPLTRRSLIPNREPYGIGLYIY